MFRPGMKVNFLNENMSGKIVSKGAGNQWFVDIGDNFEIPVEAGELVPADMPAGEAAEDSDANVEHKPASELLKQPSNKGIFLAFEKGGNETELILYLINNSVNPVLYALHTLTAGIYNALSFGEADAASKTRAAKVRLDRMEEWNHLHVQLVECPSVTNEMPPPVILDLHITGQKLRKSLQYCSELGKEAFVFELGKEKEKIQLKKEEPETHQAEINMDAPPEVLDLHIANLFPGQHIEMDQMLDLQLSAFQSVFHKAIALDYPKLIVIHGLGSGKLKSEIMLILKKEPRVHIIREADSRKYGYGATEVIFR